ncbi:hypothetical protein DSY14_04675 [Nocardiopsis sp. MG754419]|nr:hypothetical protein [Nocardiopsis sp. MG754419]
MTGSITLLIISIPLYLALTLVHDRSRRRSIHATDDLVVAGLLRERKQRELQITRDSVNDRLAAVRKCERLIYGHLPPSTSPERLSAVVSVPKAQEILEGLLEHNRTVNKRTEEQLADMEQQLTKKRMRIIARNRRFRFVDRSLYLASSVVRVWLIITVLYVAADLAFGPFS